jgi:hypothetical protein
MPRYVVSGAWRKSGMPGQITGVANSAEAAELIANDSGLMVERTRIRLPFYASPVVWVACAAIAAAGGYFGFREFSVSEPSPVVVSEAQPAPDLEREPLADSPATEFVAVRPPPPEDPSEIEQRSAEILETLARQKAQAAKPEPQIVYVPVPTPPEPTPVTPPERTPAPEIPVTCTTCGGEGRHQCRGCGGTGRFERREPCQMTAANGCGGAGERPCFNCRGQATKLCRSCNGGGGTISPKGEKVPCTACGGDGRRNCPRCMNGIIRCPKCKGTGGKVTSERCIVCKGATKVTCGTCDGKGRR